MKAKPFVKWAGGKGQLIEQLQSLFPPDLATRENLTYVEPFVGGGAMVFYMLAAWSREDNAYEAIRGGNPNA
ncbi:MAG: DNA adenine methylase [Kiritimatiellae bacterium]|nr:DNA adenine methylase [Kiritimatiellia bacterium]